MKFESKLAEHNEDASSEGSDEGTLIRDDKVTQVTIIMEECTIAVCKMSKVAFQHEMRKAARREGTCWTAYLITLLIFAACLLSYMWIIPSMIWKHSSRNITLYTENKPHDDSAGLSYDPTKTDLFDGHHEKDRLNSILDSFVLEETYSFETLNSRRYIAFEKRGSRTDGSIICASQHATLLDIESEEEEEFLNRFLKQAASMLMQWRKDSQPDLGQTITMWTSGYINVSSDNPYTIRWGHYLIFTPLVHLLGPLGRSTEYSMYPDSDPDKPAINNYTHFCNITQAMLDIKLAKAERTKEPIILDVIKDFRENQMNPGCWLLSRRTRYPHDENFIFCEDWERKALKRYDANLNYVGQRYSDVSNMYYKFFSNKAPLIEAKRICEDESSRLLTFNSEKDERDFDTRLWSYRDYIFSHTNLSNRKEDIRLFTSGWYVLSSVNSSTFSWGHHNPMVTNDTATYTNFCPDEKRKARDLFMQDNSNRLFVVLKDFTGRLIDKEAFNERRSCWRLEPYRKAKEMDFESYFACQTKKMGKVTKIRT